MRRTLSSIAALGVVLAAAAAVASEDGKLELTAPDGAAIQWSKWCVENAPAAIFLWSSWAPGNREALTAAEDLRAAAESHGLAFVIVAIQEPIDDSRRALSTTELPWLHDRHGTLLKALRLYRIPTVAVVSEDGGLVEELAADADALRRWRRP